MSAVKTIQQMQAVGIQWSFEGGAMKLQSGANVPASLVKAINQNRKEIIRLVRNQPTAQQLELLSELESLNAQWDVEAEKETQGYPGESETEVMARLCPIVDRATELYESLKQQNPGITTGLRCLFD